MSRTLTIEDKQQGSTTFRIFKDGDKQVRCAFLERCCSPDCAACEITGLVIKCNRRSFEIGTQTN